jgi:NADPH:quinone reductase-like Zn-dependent oxidoreductase
MAKLVRFHQLGGPEVLRIEEVATPEPGRQEVRLAVQAIGLNRAEFMFMHGYYPEPTRLPAMLGYEAAGIVTAVGPEVDKGWLSQAVSTIPSFSMNQYGVLGNEVIVPVHSIAAYPKHLDAKEAASIWMQYMTAYGALLEIGELKQGEFVVITAASSSVGLAAIETVKAERGISIAVTRKSEKRDELVTLGADHVIATEEEDLAARVKAITKGMGARILFDPVAGPLLGKLVEAAAPGATIFQYGWLSLASTAFPVLPVLTKGLTVRGYWLQEIVFDPGKFARAKKYVYEHLQDKRFHPKIAKTFRFEDVVQAYHYMESNQQIGKVVLTVDHMEL